MISFWGVDHGDAVSKARIPTPPRNPRLTRQLVANHSQNRSSPWLMPKTTQNRNLRVSKPR